jgi:hypothetical protein
MKVARGNVKGVETCRMQRCKGEEQGSRGSAEEDKSNENKTKSKMSKRVRGKNQKTNILWEPKSYLSINIVAYSQEK